MKSRQELQAELDELEAANAAAPGWGAAVGARIERIRGIRSQLARMPVYVDPVSDTERPEQQ